MNSLTSPARNVESNRPLPRGDLAVFPLDDDLVLYDPQSGQSFVLNPTGRIVWSLFDEARSIQAIVDEVVATFGIPTGQAQRDVENLLDQLSRSDLLLKD